MDQFPERRNEVRLYYRAHLIIEESDVCFIYKARLVNFNGRGLNFETDLLLQPGAKVCIGIYDPSKRLFSKDYVRLIVEIIWRSRITEVSFNYGYGAMEIYNDEPKDLRKDPRKTVSKLAYFALKNKYYKGVIRNLSRGGAFVETKAKFSNGDELKLVVPGRYMLLKGEIIYLKPTGFGIEFKRMSKIEKFIATKKIPQ